MRSWIGDPPRTVIVSVFCAMVLSTKFSLPDWSYMRPSGRRSLITTASSPPCGP